MLDIDKADEASREAAEQIAEEGAEIARQAGLSTRIGALAHSWRQPRQLILSEAETVRASAIVMGSRGLTGLKSLLLGSVSHGVIQRADRTVIVIPSPEVAGARSRNRHALETSSR